MSLPVNYSDVTQLIPHRPPMVLIDVCTIVSSSRAVAEKTFERGMWGTEGELVCEPALIESLAQAAAALKGASSRALGAAPAVGYLAGINDFEFFYEARCGETLRLEVDVMREFGQFFMASVQALVGQTVVCRGTITFFQTEGHS